MATVDTRRIALSHRTLEDLVELQTLLFDLDHEDLVRLSSDARAREVTLSGTLAYAVGYCLWVERTAAARPSTLGATELTP